MIKTPWRLAGRLLARDWRSGEVLVLLDFTPGLALWLGGLLAGAWVVGVSGTLAVRSVINHSPVATLRGA